MLNSGHRNTPPGTKPKEAPKSRKPANYVCPQTQYARHTGGSFHFDVDTTQFAGYDDTPSGGTICRKCGAKVHVIME